MNNVHKEHILFHRSTPWSGSIKGSTNVYADKFVKNKYDVSYMCGVVHVGHLLTGRGNYESWRKGGRYDSGAWVFTPVSVVPFMGEGPLSRPKAADWSYRSCIPSIENQLHRSGQGNPDIIWTARPGSGILTELFPEATLIFQVVDYYPAYRGEHFKDIERRDYERADHIFLIGHAMLSYLTEELSVSEKKITVLGQGVSIDEYQGNNAEPEEICELPHPRLIWVGRLDKGDPDLFKAAAEVTERLGGSLTLIGPTDSWIPGLRAEFDSVNFLGPRSPDSIPAYLTNADIGLMLYDQRRPEVYYGQNPLKLYEYAAAGLGILSTPHEEFRYLSPPVFEVDNADDVEKGVRQVMNNYEEFSDEADDFSRKRSWERCFKKAESVITNLS
ncbi:glycosyltransferase [Salinibacter ruber]|uniref:glycosyltransferase n=1 Tax=Salinibacter ruber TaxID=146919 RepID=UPI002169AEBB|nr:glycosyltransferase [Salinibacter ruber]MCS4101404.1 glycosyltransferase involved in cell wall biosynthesis [Salinibacter ruber]